MPPCLLVLISPLTKSPESWYRAAANLSFVGLDGERAKYRAATARLVGGDARVRKTAGQTAQFRMKIVHFA